MVNALDVDPYGKKLPGRQVFSSNYEGYRYQFTGHETDGETGYQYHGARYYAEELGRYMGVDPLAMKFASWSTYNYAVSNPVMMTDPTGMSAQGWGGTYKDPSRGEAGGVTWTYDPNLNSGNYKSQNYDVYMDEGQRHNMNLGDNYTGDVYLTADGRALKGHKSNAAEFEFTAYSTKPKSKTELYVQQANPFKKKGLIGGLDFSGTGSGNIYSGGIRKFFLDRLFKFKRVHHRKCFFNKVCPQF